MAPGLVFRPLAALRARHDQEVAPPLRLASERNPRRRDTITASGHGGNCLTRLPLGDLAAGSSIVVSAVASIGGDSAVEAYTVGAGADTSPPAVLGVQASATYRAGGVTGTECDRWIDPHFNVRLEPEVEDDGRVIAYAIYSHPEDALIRVEGWPSLQQAPTSGFYCYRVVAIDAGGNESAPSEPVCIELTVPADAQPGEGWCDDDGDDTPPTGDEGPGESGDGDGDEQAGAVDGGAPDAAEGPGGGCSQTQGADVFALLGLVPLLLVNSRRRERGLPSSGSRD